MSRESKNITTSVLITVALFQGPILYYFTDGFSKLVFIIFFGSIGLIPTLILFAALLRNRATTSRYHVVGLVCAFVVGLSTITGGPIEFLDWTLRKSERNQIVEEVKQGKLKPNSKTDNYLCKLPGFYILPVSNDGNEITISSYGKGSVYIEFYIDRGFLDHFSAFVYTNDPDQMQKFDNGIGPFGGGVVKKLDSNWYRVSY